MGGSARMMCVCATESGSKIATPLLAGLSHVNDDSAVEQCFLVSREWGRGGGDKEAHRVVSVVGSRNAKLPRTLG